MKIAVTGCNGSVGRRVVLNALKQGHSVIGIDRAPTAPEDPHPVADDAGFAFFVFDCRDFDATMEALRGCEGVVHVAAHRNPTDYLVKSHNDNVIMSWNVLRACAELGITHIAMASSVNVLPMVFSVKPHFDYFPIDEDHPCQSDEPYGLSKLIGENRPTPSSAATHLFGSPASASTGPSQTPPRPREGFAPTRTARAKIYDVGSKRTLRQTRFCAPSRSRPKPGLATNGSLSSPPP